MQNDYSAAILLHLVDWTASADIVPIATGISLNRLAGTQVEKLYFDLCKNGHDEGDPHGHLSFMHFESCRENKFYLETGDPYSQIDQLANLIVITQKNPIGLARIIISSDNFTTSVRTENFYSYGPQIDALEREAAPLDDASISDIKLAWGTIRKIWLASKGAGRISNAMVFFYYAWRSRYLDQVCINLAISLECLFSPHQSGETTHQIAYSVAQFVGGERIEREKTFEFIKQFYGLRSRIVHGGNADDEKLFAVVPKAFKLIATMLSQILVKPDLALSFEDEVSRRELLRGLLFEGGEGAIAT